MPGLAFHVWVCRASFETRGPLRFPALAGNAFRGALGFRLPGEVFAPRHADGPSGLRDRPRPFVLRAAHLDAAALPAGACFELGLNVFSQAAVDPLREALGGLRVQGSTLTLRGFSVGQASVDLGARDAKMDEGQPVAGIRRSFPLPDGRGWRGAASAGREGGGRRHASPDREGGGRLPTEEHDSQPKCAAPPSAIRVRLVTPLAMKGWTGEGLPPFPVLVARLRDRVSALASFYGGGPPDLDFAGLARRAALVEARGGELVDLELRRRSSRTGRTNPMGGAVGWVEYAGPLAEFLGLLEAGYWTGAGRHTVWGQGWIELCEPAAG